MPSIGFVLTTRVADVERPVARFRRAFAVVVTFTVALILWVSLRQIRHTLAPLERLREMAEGLQKGRFDARVSVSSEDEFASLGASFNLMAEEVQRTVGELKALNVGTLEALAGRQRDRPRRAHLRRRRRRRRDVVEPRAS